MSSLPQVTGITIVYNGATYLDEAIRSVRAQTFRDWELLIVDDGSTDTSREIAGCHAVEDARIRLVEHPDRRNHGMSATRNIGLSQAKGAYVGFVDADDVWLPTKIEDQLTAFGENPESAMVYGRTLIWHSWEVASVGEDFFYELGVAPNRMYAPPMLFRNLLRNVYQTPTTCNALMRRSAVEEVGGFDESFTAMFEDQTFFAKLLLKFPVFVSDHCWAKYRQHAHSSSTLSGAADADADAHLRYLQSVRRYLLQPGRRRAGDLLAVQRTLITRRSRGLAHRAKHHLALRRNR